jgi:energy-coupling factor transport system ATP-binding protein
MDICRITGLTFSYAGASKKALNDISVEIVEGSFTIVCGGNGSGKTTLLRHITPELTPHGTHSGTIEISGSAGFVSQDPDNQIVTDTVWHELAFGAENLGLNPDIIRRRVMETAHYFGINTWMYKKTDELSQGQKQLLNLASVMVMRPDILVLDEPTAQLDPIAAKEFLATLTHINTGLGTTVVISEHRLEEVLPLAHRVLYMDDGRIALDVTATQFAKACPDGFSAALPWSARLYKQYADGKQEVPISIREGRQWLRNAGLSKCERARTPVGNETVLEAKNIWFRYSKDDDFVLSSLDLSLKKGEAHCIVGGNGSGKTTLLNILAGIKKAQRGHMRTKARISMLTQNVRVLFLTDAVISDLRKASGNEENIRQAAETLHISHLLERDPGGLSHGELKKAAIAKVLLTRPDILLLDEPTDGIDAFARDELLSILKGLLREGCSMIVVSHDLEFVARLADRCSMMGMGRLVCEDSGHDFFIENDYYTTAVHRLTRGIIDGCVILEDVCKER